MSVFIHDGCQFQLIADALPGVAPVIVPTDPAGVLAGVDINKLEPDDGNIGLGIGAANNPPLAAETVDASGKPVPNVIKF